MEPNDYLNQVMQDQARVEGELRQRWAAPAPAAPAGGAGRGVVEVKKGAEGLGEEREEGPRAAPGPAVEHRVTGFWRWKTVVVPPNVYVVHTRRGHPEPLHVGLGLSFRFDPATDAFLVIPAAVQTLLINARCICAERQGVLVQAYVQWIVDDVRTAYRKLDFSDASDPMRIVNVQLREQAEAAIKDKVATMPIDAVLADKQPIIEELTHRLRAVAEGSRAGDPSSGLGLKIVTVQIKEAVVSSRRLWENLQKPFRAEREKLARMAELEAQEEIARRELANRQARETAELETARALDLIRAQGEREAYDRARAEQARRHQLEQAAEQQALAERAATEKARRAADDELAAQQHELEGRRAARELEAVGRQVELERARAELERLRTAAGVERADLVHQAESARKERDVAVLQKRRAVANDLSEALVRQRLIARLPEIAAALPKPDELRAISVGGDGATPLTGLLAGLLQAVEGALKRPAPGDGQAAP
jgi:regulator of protease activity HflC (stomatin/prohibitin superfamily)